MSQDTRTATAHLPALGRGAEMPRTARQVLALLPRLAVGVLDLQLPDGGHRRYGEPRPGEPRAAMRVLDWGVFGRTLTSGDIGFAEAYLDGQWTSPDIPALLQLFLANRKALEDVVYGRWWGGLAYRLKHLLNRNSRRGSRKNIHAHYDIGNDFYRLWLDETMNYSSAWFDGDLARPMPEAQNAKVRRALQACGVAPGDRVLEIGCGWGALAATATGEFGARVVGVTLSDEQLAWAKARLERLGRDTMADLRLQDYRDIADEPFDAIVSIEMFEAVGEAYWDGYFRTVRDKLKPGGRACIQSIVIRDDLFERYRRGTDFIQQYIFPGGLLPSPSAFRAAAAKAGLAVEDELAFGADYAETLRRWRNRFLGREGDVRRLGFDTRFLRVWEFYLAYCEAAFATGNTDVMQFTLRRD